MRFGLFLSGLLVGTVTGAAIGILTAPKAGSRLRREIAAASNNISRRAAYELEELGDRLQELTAKVETLKETAVQPAQQAAEETMAQCEQSA